MLTATHLERFPWRTRDSCRSHPSAHEKLPLTSMYAFYILLDRADRAENIAKNWWEYPPYLCIEFSLC